jgi:transposase
MVKRSKGKRILLFSDEAGFCLHPKLGRIWVKRGKQPLVLTKSQHHKRLNVFGWVNPIGGTHGMLRQEKGNTDGFIAMLKNILRRYQRVLIELWVDQARWHKGKKITEFLSYHSQLVINYIPKYHPELNPQEMLWRTMRYEETTNIYYETFEELVSSVFKRSQTWKPKKIMPLCHFI